MQNFEKHKKMVWRYGVKVPFHQILALICITGSEKTGFTDDGRTTDARVTTVPLLCSTTKQS